MSVFRFDLVGVFLSVFAVRNFFSLCLCLYQINGIFTQKQLNENTQMCKWNSNSIESNSILFNSIRMNQDRDKSIYWAMLWRNYECLDSQNLHNFVDRKLMAQQDDCSAGKTVEIHLIYFLHFFYLEFIHGNGQGINCRPICERGSKRTLSKCHETNWMKCQKKMSSA